MPRKWSEASKRALKNVHPDLVRVLENALKNGRRDFRVLEGRRTKARQAKLVKEGASKIMNSRHLGGFAVDLGVLRDGKISWHWPEYIVLAADIKKAAMDERVRIEWGGDWPHFKDGGHFELSRANYPDPK
jgi:peptidoglycan L-alanyl-D-glutamate endopeptidase CwlK